MSLMSHMVKKTWALKLYILGLLFIVYVLCRMLCNDTIPLYESSALRIYMFYDQTYWDLGKNYAFIFSCNVIQCWG